jgi:hypothetical protein
MFSKIVRQSRYNQIRVWELDIEKNVFSTKYGHYQYDVSFRQTNAPPSLWR